MRRDPGTDGEVIKTADGCIDNPDPNCARPLLLGAESGYRWLYLFDGPVEADGYTWYLAATEMNTEAHASTYPEGVGWVASGDEADAWLVPDTDRSCPRPPIELADVTNLVMTKLEMLHCFGNQELTLRGWYPTLPRDAIEDPVQAESCRAHYGWIACDSIYDILSPEERTWVGDAHYLDFVIDPAVGVSMPARGQWVTVSGSFDHPAADSCGGPGAVLICRSTFAVTTADPG
jgi:hypothetical protein